MDVENKSANDLKIENTNISKFSIKQQDKSLINNADLSVILNENRNVPNYRPEVDFYENESEDLSMLKDIMSNRSGNK